MILPGLKWKNSAFSESQHGFTLMEVLIAVSLSAVIVAIVAGAINVGRKAWEKGSARMDEQQLGRWTDSLIRRQIGSVCSRQIVGKKIYPLTGDTQYMRFVTSASSDGGSGDSLYIVAYSVVKDHDTSLYKLVIEEENFASNMVSLRPAGNGGFTDAVRRRELIAGLSGIRFAYKSSLPAKNTPWLNAWGDLERFPSAVLVELVFSEDKTSRIITSIDQIEIPQ